MTDDRYKYFQCLKTLKEIVAPQYGLQGIQEDYGHDVNAYNFHAMEYWKSECMRLQQIARVTIRELEIGDD